MKKREREVMRRNWDKRAKWGTGGLGVGALMTTNVATCDEGGTGCGQITTSHTNLRRVSVAGF